MQTGSELLQELHFQCIIEELPIVYGHEAFLLQSLKQLAAARELCRQHVAEEHHLALAPRAEWLSIWGNSYIPGSSCIIIILHRSTQGTYTV